LKEISKFAANRKFTDLVVLREGLGKPTELIVVHLPEGPSFTFNLMNYKHSYEIIGHANPTNHDPEIILNNFSTKLGRRVARQFAALFPQKPEFIGRQAVTFHN